MRSLLMSAQMFATVSCLVALSVTDGGIGQRVMLAVLFVINMTSLAGNWTQMTKESE